MLADQTLNKLLEKDFITVLDIGCGRGSASEMMLNHNKTVTAIDTALDKHYLPKNINFIRENYFLHEFKDAFDAIWCSHVLEHQQNTLSFLQKINNDLKEGGWLAITVPPRKDEIVDGHVSIWNAGLLIYNLVLAGFDCKFASIKTYDYNCSVVVKKQSFILPSISYGTGDLELLKPWLPECVKHRKSGVISEWNWT
jgi:SAM-dependent methyltransferase